MIAEHGQLMSILYTPLTYAHSDKLPSIDPSINLISDTLINYWIIKQYQLDDLPDSWRSYDSITKLIISNWYYIPKISYFIGGYLFREKLVFKPMTLISDPLLLNFISLPLRHTIRFVSGSDDINHSMWGSAFILGLLNNPPIALLQRLHLFFPYDVNPPKIHVSRTPDHINLLKMAIHYACNSNK